ncbi:MAG TPA: family 1 glycosylhydrolase [Thermoanaerobaculaceae bacterium]|nr:family 1 glycosylhydrolase [Thermoanaerobaculaceae bacterium]
MSHPFELPLALLLPAALALLVLVLNAIACAVLAARYPLLPPFTAQELGRTNGGALPRGFLWGTATSAHQVEGGNAHNDWWAFEQEPGRIARGERSGRAADHWNRVREDVGLMARLNANAYRFSIEWSRVEPREGVWDEAAWAHYQDEVRQLRAAGIEPMVTLHHFTLPIWLRSGLLEEAFPARFARFAEEAARRLGPEVTLWCTVNEPNVLMFKGFVEGTWPPAVRDPVKAATAFTSLLRAHALAAAALRTVLPGARIGAAIHLRLFDPARRWLLLDWLGARASAQAFDWAFYDAITSGRIRLAMPGYPRVNQRLDLLRGSADWLGVNYYTRDLVRFSPAVPGLVERKPGPGPRSDLDWEVYPEGLLQLLRAAHARYRLPLYVTENGIADREGSLRASFIRSHLHAVVRAVREGIPVLGYFHWSLIDNFEWNDGFEPRFGLYRVDDTTLERAPAPGWETFSAFASEANRPLE